MIPGVVVFGEDEVQGLPLHRVQASAAVVLEYRFTNRDSLVVQYLYTTAAAMDLHEFSSGSHEVAAGMRTRLRKGLDLEWAAIENMVRYENSPDFGVHLGLCYRF